MEPRRPPGVIGCLASILESIADEDTPIKVVSKGGHPLAVPGKRHAGYRIVADVTSAASTSRPIST